MIFDTLSNAAYRVSLHGAGAELEEVFKHPSARCVRRRAAAQCGLFFPTYMHDPNDSDQSCKRRTVCGRLTYIHACIHTGEFRRLEPRQRQRREPDKSSTPNHNLHQRRPDPFVRNLIELISTLDFR